MDIILAGEDELTKAVAIRICMYCCKDITVVQEIPARGSEIFKLIPNLNNLSKSIPVVLLIDLDSGCPPEKKARILPEQQQPQFIFCIAVDEVEAWLLADRKNFSEYFEIDINELPSSQFQRFNGRKQVMEIFTRYKTSMYLCSELAPKSRNLKFRDQLIPKLGASKGPEYNNCMLSFLNKWNIDNAIPNSDSLSRMISRIRRLTQI